MRSSYVIGSLALAAGNALASPQAVTASIAPQAAAPAGCSPSHSGQFQITVQNVTTGSKVKRDALECTLAGGVLKDAQGRTGYIASNFQFQFDGPPQAGSIYTAGFSLCGNGSLALGGSAIWYQCLSGGFYNLYDRSWAPQCSPIYIEAIGYSATATSVGQLGDGQPIATTSVSQRPDGQVLATTAVTAPKPVSQIGDGQIQVHPSAQPISQISDGQIQVPPAAPAATGKPLSEMTDGQVNKPTAPAAPSAVSQISDGQVQAPPATAKPIANATGSPISQISDGQVQAGTATKGAANVSATHTPAQVSVNAAPMQTVGGIAVAGIFAVAAALL
ncbi:hypothetical protein Vi05172_g7241 [Venturia inaequalis]|nr:hypothetical protein Vi05172_g7241 [Venturia inaequalis]